MSLIGYADWCPFIPAYPSLLHTSFLAMVRLSRPGLTSFATNGIDQRRCLLIADPRNGLDHQREYFVRHLINLVETGTWSRPSQHVFVPDHHGDIGN